MVSIDQEKGLAVIRAQGALQLQDFHALTETLIDHPDFRPEMDSIWDFRQADLSCFDAGKLHNLALFMLPRLKQLPKRHAIIVGRELEYGIMRMWDVIAQRETPQERRLFWDYDEGVEWLLTSRS